MEVEKTKIEGLLLIKPSVFKDSRGFFLESFNIEKYKKVLGTISFVQDNLSHSMKNVLRGIHFQAPPFGQGKLVQVLQGEVLDVVVDLRSKSKTFGQHETFLLNDKNKNQLWIPEGFGHAFLTKVDNTIFSYKCSNYYSSKNEATLLWNDPQLNIDWGIENPILSQKDNEGKLLNEMQTYF